MLSGPSGFSFSPAGSKDVTIPNAPAGNYTFRYSISGACVNGTKDISFTVTAGSSIPLTGANANAGAIPTGFCIGSIPASLLLAANQPNVGETGTWTQTGGSTVVNFSDIHDPHAVLTGMTAAGSPYQLTWTIANVAGCNSSSPVTFSLVDPLNLPPINFTTVCSANNITSFFAGPCFQSGGVNKIMTLFSGYLLGVPEGSRQVRLSMQVFFLQSLYHLMRLAPAAIPALPQIVVDYDLQWAGAAVSQH
jgi:hypothetical protein